MSDCPSFSSIIWSHRPCFLNRTTLIDSKLKSCQDKHIQFIQSGRGYFLEWKGWSTFMVRAILLKLKWLPTPQFIGQFLISFEGKSTWYWYLILMQPNPNLFCLTKTFYDDTFFTGVQQTILLYICNTYIRTTICVIIIVHLYNQINWSVIQQKSKVPRYLIYYGSNNSYPVSGPNLCLVHSISQFFWCLFKCVSVYPTV